MLPKIPLLTPRKTEIVITLDRVIVGLVILLTLFLFVKIYQNGSLAKNLVNSNASVLLSQIQNVNDTESFNKYFTSGYFCGWKIEREKGATTSSADYDTTSREGDILARDFETGGLKQTFYLCISELDNISGYVNRQFIFVLLLSGAILFLLNVKNKSTKNENSEKIPNS